MFFERRHALRGLDAVRDAVRPGGVAFVNVLVEGTTFMKMFDEDAYCLFPRDALLARFTGWTVLDHRIEDFEAPEPGTIKRFATLIARCPAATN
jgi:tellurite methyltransferase